MLFGKNISVGGILHTERYRAVLALILEIKTFVPYRCISFAFGNDLFGADSVNKTEAFKNL
jgi:hypothetical protein